MVATLGIAVVILAVITLLNLALTLAVLRRMRESRLWDTQEALPAPGAVVGEFNEATVDGLELSERRLAEGTHLIVFLSASCQPCRELVESIEGGMQLPVESLAFIERDAEDAAVAQMVSRVRRLLPVAVDSTGSAARAFQVEAFPAVMLVADGVVTVASHRLDDVLAAAPSNPA